jgi:hypothetical protein
MPIFKDVLPENSSSHSKPGFRLYSSLHVRARNKTEKDIVENAVKYFNSVGCAMKSGTSFGFYSTLGNAWIVQN